MTTKKWVNSRWLAMRYTYAYRTSDGVRHEASMDAESREAVFVALRARGIRAIKVVAADGSKANGEGPPSPRPRRARSIFRIAFSFAALLLAAFAVRGLLEFRSCLNKIW